MYIPKEWYIALSAPLVANPMNPVDQTTLKDRVNDLDKVRIPIIPHLSLDLTFGS